MKKLLPKFQHQASTLTPILVTPTGVGHDYTVYDNREMLPEGAMLTESERELKRKIDAKRGGDYVRRATTKAAPAIASLLMGVLTFPYVLSPTGLVTAGTSIAGSLIGGFIGNLIDKKLNNETNWGLGIGQTLGGIAGTGLGYHFPTNNIKNLILDYNIGNSNLSYYLNRNKLVLPDIIGEWVNAGGETSVFNHATDPSRVIKVSKFPVSKDDADLLMRSIVRRNKNPYYLKERIEGILKLDNDKVLVVTSQEKINPENIVWLPTDEELLLQNKLMAKKGFYRMTPDEIIQLPYSRKLVYNKEILLHVPIFLHGPNRLFVKDRISNVFTNKKWYMTDAGIGDNGFIIKKPHKNIFRWFTNRLFDDNNYSLQYFDNDAISLNNENTEILPLADKRFNQQIIDNISLKPEDWRDFEGTFRKNTKTF